ncbi:MAG: S8/S53 family peptidase, partial [Bacteroidia bacterium]
HVSGYYSLAKTRRLPQTRYVEPLGYDVRPETVEINVSNKSGGSCPPKSHTHNFNVWDPLRLGCSNEADPNTNYSLTQPNYSIVPWHYKHSRVRVFNAWNHSQGDNITIGMIDSGTSPHQANLNGQFATGWSTGRSITRVGKFNPWYPIPFTRPDGPNDNCGHGTLMAGCAAAPRNGYSTVGVAYKANLVAVRGADDVFLNSTQERKGVFESFVYLGNRSDVKIISMSMGYPWFWVQTLADGVNFAYGKQKLIFCAAGTSTGLTNWTGTIFPARMSNKVYAVTGVKDVWPTIKKRCKVCHAGGHVDFVVPMQKDKNRYGFSTDCEKTNSLMMEGNSPARVGGSSIATATMAGITALVWAKNPSMSRTSVVNILKNAADYYPNDHPDFGWGVVNAEAAVLAAAPAPAPMRVTINGPTSIQSSGYYTWTASTTNAPSAPSYNWSRLVTNPGMGYISSCNGTGNSYGCYVTVFGTGWGSFAKINVSATASGQTKTAVKNLTR